MAQEITCPLIGDFISGPGCVIPLADQTGTTTGAQFVGLGGRNIMVQRLQAQIFFKTFVVGNGTAYPMFALEVSSDSGFGTVGNIRRIAQFQPPLVEAIGAIPATNPRMSFLLNGFVPDGGKNYARIKTLASGTSTFVFDVIFAGA